MSLVILILLKNWVVGYVGVWRARGAGPDLERRVWSSLPLVLLGLPWRLPLDEAATALQPGDHRPRHPRPLRRPHHLRQGTRLSFVALGVLNLLLKSGSQGYLSSSLMAH